MRLRYLFLGSIFLFQFHLDLFPQSKKDIRRIDNIMIQIPDTSTLSSDGIATYIKSALNVKSDRAYAIFSWITGNIDYDVENMFSIDFYQPSDNVIQSVLKSKTGVCLHFADLFQDIAEKCGINSYVIHGYTRQNGLMDHIPHAWCSALIDTVWYLFDPAWGSGYFENGSFFKRRNLKCYKVHPYRFIKTHMPFDPIWQFLNYPITNHDFYNHKITPEENSPFFNYADSIKKYDRKSELEKVESSIVRVKQAGITNVLIYREIRYMNEQIMKTKYNTAVRLYNDGITQFNKSIVIWNEFNPDKNTNAIAELLDSAEYSAALSRYYLSLIKDPAGFIKISIDQLHTLLKIAEESITDLRSSVLRYQNSRNK